METKKKITGPETRILETVVENRAADGRRIDGIAAKVGVLSRTLYGWFKEMIDPGAFDGADMNDVVCLKNHDQNLILARTLNNSLELAVNAEGHLAYGFEAPSTTTGNDTLEEVKSKLIQHSSFSFEVEEDRWEEDSEGNEIRHIVKFRKIHDVSPVVNPAYLQTEAVAARNIEIAKEYRERSKPPKVETEEGYENDLALEQIRLERNRF